MSFLPIPKFDGYTLYELKSQGNMPLLDAIDPSREDLSGAIRFVALLLKANVKTIVCEDNYYDEDHTRSFLRKHGRSIADNSIYCKRFHFFQKDMDVRRFQEIWTQNGENCETESYGRTRELGYVGYVVARNFHDTPLTRITLSCRGIREAYRSFYKTEDIVCHFSSCVPSSATIAGLTFSFDAIPFISPDSEAGVCGSAAAWVVLRTLNMKGGHAPWLGLAEVTDMATQQITLGHIMPNQGLVASQLCGVFRDAGLDPFVRNVGDLPLSDFSDKSKRQELLDRWNWILYSLQEGGMPILLFVRSGKVAHVITIVGHTYYVTQEPLRLYTFKGDFPEKEQHKWLSFHSTSDITKDFILHDPYFGPYELAELDYKETMTSRGKESIELVLKLKKPFGDRTSRDIESWSIDLVLAATPKEVSIDTVDAEVIAIRFWNMHIAKTDPFPASTDLVFRSLLLHNNEVKSHLGSGDTGLHKEVLTKLRPLSLPKWVYLVEIRHNTETEAAMRDGLILVDATTTSQRRRVLVVYYRDQMWIRSSLTNEPLPEMITEMKWLELNVEPNARFKAIHLPTDVKLNLPSTESTDESSTL